MHFLVIDDEEAIGECIQLAIAQTGHECEYYSNPLLAVKAFKKNPHKYHGIFTDLRMPQMRGEEVIKRVKEVDGVTPIVIITASGGMFTTEDLQRLKIVSLIAKPFDITDIEKAVYLMREHHKTVA